MLEREWTGHWYVFIAQTIMVPVIHLPMMRERSYEPCTSRNTGFKTTLSQFTNAINWLLFTAS